jgi:stage V sporulation protein D (sporulation-specific penicillin-binding protein)
VTKLTKNRIPKGRINAFFIFSALVFLAWVVRLFWVQVVWSAELRQQAADYRTKTNVLQPVRGNIYDRNGNELVISVPSFSVYARPSLVTDPHGAAAALAPLLKLPEEEVYNSLIGNTDFAWLKRRVPPEDAEEVRALKLEGVGLVEETQRVYKQGNLAAHLLGFVGDDNQGLTGLEKKYDRELSGSPGFLVTESDATGEPLPQDSLQVRPSLPGKNLVLTIDQAIQYMVEKELDKIVSEYQPARASITVMDPQTGEILALGNRPSFSPESWRQTKEEVWEGNTAVLYNYEPGSVLKMFLAAAAFEEKVVRPEDSFYCPGYATVSGQKISCWEKGGHGHETFLQAVENSCNPVFIQVGLKLGKERVYQYLKKFGFGSPTGIDLPGEETGILKPVDSVTDLDLATISIGQSISATPLQILNATCAIANGGRLMRPYLVKEIYDPERKTGIKTKPVTVGQVISKETAAELTGILEHVVFEGTGKRAGVEGYRIAGKTGTAQIPGPDGYLEGKYIASFAGFAPSRNPRIAILVMIVEPKGKEYHGGEVAAPAFQNLTKSILAYLGVPEEKELTGQAFSAGQLPSSFQPVPNVVGFPAEQADRLLESRGFVSRRPAGEGIVREQSPSPGTPVKPGSPVDLFLREPLSEEVEVPQLTGLSAKEAGEVCEALGLPVRMKGSGLVQKQDPAAGRKVRGGTPVILELAENRAGR